MVDNNDSEKRDCVRAALRTDVRFSILDPDEFAVLQKNRAGLENRNQTCLGSRFQKEEDGMTGSDMDPQLVDFLVQLDDKLEKILDILVKNETSEREVFVGRGLDIGGGGMRLFCTKEILPGQVLDAAFRIYRYPPVSLKVFAKVTRVQGRDINGIEGFEAALEFLDLDEAEKECIISYVFQKQRESIRKKRNK